MDDDWDLQAVVRSCAAATSSSTSTPTPTETPPPSDASVKLESFSSSSFHQPQLVQQQDEEKLLCFQDLYVPRDESSSTILFEELRDLCHPFFPKPSLPPQRPQPLSPQSLPVSPLSVLGGFQDLSSSQPNQQLQSQTQQQQGQLQPQQQLLFQTQHHHQPKQTQSSCVSRTRNTSAHTNARSKRRKNQMKRVCQVPAEGLSSDMWSWRKYGQKPIKGSPYPRGYYRCSTSKGCLARKQVERNRSDPNMFIVTYTAEHNHPMPTHRNSLAGSTRQKPATPQSTTTSDDPNKSTTPRSDSPTASHSSAPEKLEGNSDDKEGVIEEDDDDFSISDVPLDDDFFVGLDEEPASPAPATAHNDCFANSTNFQSTTQFPWLSNKVTTTAAGGG